MNMLLLEEGDFFAPGKALVRGRRFDRLRNFIHIAEGKELKAGVRNTGCGRAVVTRIADDEAEVAYTPLNAPPPPLPLTLIMALQRPQTFEKVLHGAVSLGVKKIHFIHTFKVEKSYWQSSRLLPENLREEITFALEQAADPVEPELFFHRRFKPFAEDELENIAAGTLRFFGDPAGTAPVPVRGTPLTLALGPEGGFTEYETETLKNHGFRGLSTGERILRTEFALAALLGKLLL